jgi:DNA polymerase-4
MHTARDTNMPRNILHINIVSFHVAVARALEPRLGSYPVAVASAGAARRVVLDVSSQALEAGVRKYMPVDEARRKCPGLVVLDPAPEACRRAHDALMGEAVALSPRVEAAGPGHVFIDLSGTGRLFGRAVDVADRLGKSIRNKYSLAPTVGLAANKLVSKVATRVIKPVGFCTVVHGCEEEFMAPLPLHLMPGVECKVIQKLEQFNMFIISDLHNISPVTLSHAIGDVAFDIYRFSHGLDDTAVSEYASPAPSVEERVVLRQQTNDEEEAGQQLFAAVSRAGAKLRAMGLGARRISLSLVYADGGEASRSCATPVPVNGDITLFETCGPLFRAAYERRVRVSSMALRFTGLCSPYGQLDLFYDAGRETELMRAIDMVRERQGENAVAFGRAGKYDRA